MKSKTGAQRLSMKVMRPLGGNEEDLDLIDSSDDQEECMEIGEDDNDGDKIIQSEVHQFVKSFNWKGHAKSPFQAYNKNTENASGSQRERKPRRTASESRGKASVQCLESQTKEGHVTDSKQEKGRNKFTNRKEMVTGTMFKSPLSKMGARSVTLIKPGTKWFTNQMDIESHLPKPLPEDVRKLWYIAMNLLEQDVTLYRKFLQVRPEKKDFQWIQTVLKSGTLADKVAAHTVLIQDSPVHNLPSLDALIAMVTIKGKRECLMALDTLRDLFLSDLLLEGKKLKNFDEHPLGELQRLTSSQSGNRDGGERCLLLWYFEDQLKRRYDSFVKALVSVSHDSVEKTKKKAISVMCDLLTYNSEQEQVLLASFVNKIGDPSNPVAAQVAHLLTKVVGHNPGMKAIVVDEVEHILYRPNISQRAQYYALCFLNSVILTSSDNRLASQLIGIYLGFFKACTKKGEVDSKMMSALLTGVSRAHPYAGTTSVAFNEQLDTLYRVVHTVSFNISVQALALLFQVLDSQAGPSDRFYTALYRKLLDPHLQHSSRQPMFLNLLYRALKKDSVDRRVKAFVKRLLQVSEYQLPSLMCGILFLISALLKDRPTLLDSIKSTLDWDDGDEHYEDVPEVEEEETHEPIPKSTLGTTRTEASWVHRANSDSLHVYKKTDGEYDPHHRNPLYCHAELEPPWELRNLTQHFHPSVALFASTVLQKSPVDYHSDPLQDFTLIRFLDRFVFRNPKKNRVPSAGHDKQRVFRRWQANRPVSDAKALQGLGEAAVPVDEKFMHQYFNQQSKKGPEETGGSDLDSVASEEFDQLLDRFEPGGKREDPGIDFAGEIIAAKKRKKTRKQDRAGRSESEESDVDDLQEDDAEEVDFAKDEDFQHAFKEFDEDLVNIDPQNATFDEETAAFPETDEFASSPKQKRNSETLNSRKRSGMSQLFASAEEFSMLLEENASSRLDTTTAQALANKDNADAKQLAWEMRRDQWIRGRDWKSQNRKRPNRTRNRNGKTAKTRLKGKR